MKTKLFFIMLLCGFAAQLYAQQASFSWAVRFGNTNEEQVFASAQAADGSLYLTGEFSGTLDADPGPGVFTLTAVSGIDAYLTKFDSSGQFLWAVSFGGNGLQSGRAISCDASGDVLVGGSYDGTFDADPGVGVNTVALLGYLDVFIIRLNSSGNFIWANAVGGGGTAAVFDLETDAAGHIYAAGSFNSSNDFDPGPGVFTMVPVPANGNSDCFVLKLTASGNFIRAFQFGGNGQDEIWSMDEQNGKIALTGYFHTVADLDPSVSVFFVGSAGSADVFVMVADSTGMFLHGAAWGGNSVDEGTAVTFTSTGRLFVTGNYQGNVDFDGSGILPSNTSVSGTPDVFLVSMDSALVISYVHSVGGAGGDFFPQTAVRQDGSFYLGYTFQSVIDADPGALIASLTSNGSNDIAVSRFDASGNFLWAQAFGGSSSDRLKTMNATSDGKLFIAGQFIGTCDFDPSPAVFSLTSASAGFEDVFLSSINENLCSGTTLAVDSLSDFTCLTDAYLRITAVNAQRPVLYSWNNAPATTDSVFTTANPGLVSVTATDAKGCSVQRTLLLTMPANNFADPRILLFPTGTFRSGFQTVMQLGVLNDGCLPVDGSLRFIIENHLQFDSAAPVPSVVNGDTIIWNYTGLRADSLPFKPKVYLTTTSFSLTDSVSYSADIFGASITDNNLNNNAQRQRYRIVNAWDPNDKLVYPQGECTSNYALLGEPIIYTIRFQNLGTAPAINVRITDTLSPSFDLNSVRVLAASHSLITEVHPGNELQFIFRNINLPDSISDPQGSNGYVVFELLPLTSLASGSVVENKAAIYFDFNAPVITNEPMLTLVDTILPCIALDAELLDRDLTFSVWPNPVSDEYLNIELPENGRNMNVHIYSVQGNLVRSYSALSAGRNVLSVYGLLPGVYIVQLNSNEEQHSLRVIVTNQ
ncbi:MAG: T9SS type A sorting domain-containing protein [Bacteroidota bacterium]|jgi:uncharacterized repeat protein (TIGR01451 family)